MSFVVWLESVKIDLFTILKVFGITILRSSIIRKIAYVLQLNRKPRNYVVQFAGAVISMPRSSKSVKLKGFRLEVNIQYFQLAVVG